METFGIDIGGSGIKGAVVDSKSGKLLSERLRLPTPQKPDAKSLIAVLKDLLDAFDWKKGPVGIGFPGPIRDNVILTAINLDSSLVGVNLAKELYPLKPGKITVLNDADAAGFAEMQFGVGKPYLKEGTVLLFTVGTGIGTVIFRNGILVPNMEFGTIEYKGRVAESFVSERARKKEELSWIRWAKRFNGYLQYMERLILPDFIILGGGGVKRPERFQEEIKLDTPWDFAHFGNRAGILGAGIAAARKGS